MSVPGSAENLATGIIMKLAVGTGRSRFTRRVVVVVPPLNPLLQRLLLLLSRVLLNLVLVASINSSTNIPAAISLMAGHSSLIPIQPKDTSTTSPSQKQSPKASHTLIRMDSQ